MTFIHIKFSEPQVDFMERAAVAEVLSNPSRQYVSAGRVRQFEEKFEQFIGGGRAVAVSSCTAALHLALMARRIRAGHEVIMPALNFPAAANAVEAVGAKPVFVDVAVESGTLDNRLVEDAITDRTRAIVVTHFLGQPGYMRSLLDICRRRTLHLIEDCAHALGSHHPPGVRYPGTDYRHLGLFGDVGCFSFHPAKQITTGEGGIALCSNEIIADRIRSARSFGMVDGEVKTLGLNYRLTEFQAAMGIAQMDKLPGILAQRAANAAYLRGQLPGFNALGDGYALAVEVPPTHSRDEVRQFMWLKGIETSVYFAMPVPDMLYYRRKYGRREFPVARHICERFITMTVGPHMSERKLKLQAAMFREALAA